MHKNNNPAKSLCSYGAKNLTFISRFVLIVFFFNLLILPMNIQAETIYNGGDNKEIKSLSEQIKAKQDKIKELSDKIGEYDKSIKNYRSQAVTLSSQVNYLEARIIKTEAEIELTESQISENALQIQDTENKIRQNETNINRQKKILQEFIQQMYQKDQTSELEIILGHDSVSDYYNEMRALSILQNKMNDSLKDLKELKIELNKSIAELEA